MHLFVVPSRFNTFFQRANDQRDFKVSTTRCIAIIGTVRGLDV